jgi:hypothetical protein
VLDSGHDSSRAILGLTLRERMFQPMASRQKPASSASIDANRDATLVDVAGDPD